MRALHASLLIFLGFVGSWAKGRGGGARCSVRTPQISPTDLHQHCAEGWPEGLGLLPSWLTPCSSDSITQPHGSRGKYSKKQMNPGRKGTPSCEK